MALTMTSVKAAASVPTAAFNTAGMRSRAVLRPCPFMGNAASIASCSGRVTHGTAMSRSRAVRPPMAMFGGAATAGKSFYDFTAKDIDGKSVSLKDFKDKVVLVVNVASACGFTPQYVDMQKVFAKYKPQGFEILAFPCNQFGGQEPGSNNEIKAFAARQGATFKMMSKVDVNGPSDGHDARRNNTQFAGTTDALRERDENRQPGTGEVTQNADPVWDFLKKQQGGLLGDAVKWNFTKFLVDRQGKVVKRYASTATPLDIEKDIQALL